MIEGISNDLTVRDDTETFQRIISWCDSRELLIRDTNYPLIESGRWYRAKKVRLTWNLDAGKLESETELTACRRYPENRDWPSSPLQPCEEGGKSAEFNHKFSNRRHLSFTEIKRPPQLYWGDKVAHREFGPQSGPQDAEAFVLNGN